MECTYLTSLFPNAPVPGGCWVSLASSVCCCSPGGQRRPRMRRARFPHSRERGAPGKATTATTSASTANRCWWSCPSRRHPASPGSGTASSSDTSRRRTSRCLGKGFHVVYMSVPDMLGCPEAVAHWNAFYRELTEKYGLARKPRWSG